MQHETRQRSPGFHFGVFSWVLAMFPKVLVSFQVFFQIFVLRAGVYLIFMQFFSKFEANPGTICGGE